jgi:outer membrane immunogenic protein
LLKYGTGSTNVTAWGWTVGGGVEYALTNSWTALLEYDRIEMSPTSVAFSAVAVINAQGIAVRQWMDVAKLGVNYKFGWGSGVETY